MIIGDVGKFSIFSSWLVRAPFDFIFCVIGGVL
jgi:hypothetical protein